MNKFIKCGAQARNQIIFAWKFQTKMEQKHRHRAMNLVIFAQKIKALVLPRRGTRRRLRVLSGLLHNQRDRPISWGSNNLWQPSELIEFGGIFMTKRQQITTGGKCNYNKGKEFSPTTKPGSADDSKPCQMRLLMTDACD